jgi:NTP pyrophosphatase (non-canonical NTP hydrolase)
MSQRAAIQDLLAIMARLRAPDGCPWDRAQDHQSLRFHAVEEVYEMLDAIEADDDAELMEELGDLLLQIVFHCQLAQERGAFDFEQVCRHIADKLIRRHPHVFGPAIVKDVAGVWAQWEHIKRAEKHGTHRARPSALDGIPRHLPALLRVEQLAKKARRAQLLTQRQAPPPKLTPTRVAQQLFALAQFAQGRGWSAEALLRAEAQKQERAWRRREQQRTAKPAAGAATNASPPHQNQRHKAKP